MTYTIVVCTVKKNPPDDGHRNCPKHIEEFYFKNKFEKLVHLVGFIIRILHRCLRNACEEQNIPPIRDLNVTNSEIFCFIK
jgi:hypothetical protein